jgi:hypothetical protein
MTMRTFTENVHWYACAGRQFLKQPDGFALRAELLPDTAGVEDVAAALGGWDAVAAAANERAYRAALDAAVLEERSRIGSILEFGLAHGLWDEAKQLAFIPDMKAEAATVALAAMAAARDSKPRRDLSDRQCDPLPFDYSRRH